MKYLTKKQLKLRLLYIKSNNKLTSAVNVDKPVNVETPKKNTNISSSKTTSLDK